MKMGVVLPYGSARSTARLCQAAEAAGWAGCYIGDAIWCEDPMIALTAAAMVTQRIRLGTLIIPTPLRRPWKIASESVALDRLSEGRLTLGLGAGAVWMGWQAFPDEVTDTRARAEMLDETIDILTLLYQRQPFDYNGQHFHLKLTQLDVMHYPPQPVQQPRIPLWVVGLWPRPRSMQRVLKADGVILEKRAETGQEADLTPADVRDVRAFVQAERTLTTPFDIVVQGNTNQLVPAERQEKLLEWEASGATWWIENLIGLSEAEALARLAAGAPQLT